MRLENVYRFMFAVKLQKNTSTPHHAKYLLENILPAELFTSGK